ncbi:hypothetical protein PUR34_06695 [Streptomyces sp. JV185]|uniref:hypothetical protein n=1 Tax=Streptomyces sp. JV185 TaxID=858638 RepID=UPI002E7954A4|nr:hypothetical protein [Streptomyces sp. JV185]MEE1767877.1 hypothetical protein [Streptomyces sp. JV185]
MSSSNDQQHPYGQDPRHGYGPGHDPSNGGQPQPYGDQGYGAQAYGAQPYGDQPYGGQSYGGQSYGGEAQGAQPYAQQPSYPSYGAPQQAPQANPGQGWPHGYAQEPAAPVPHDQDPAVAQTWEGQTWDTQYQPVLQSAQPAQPSRPAGPGPAADETAYLTPPLPPQGASGSYPLPPEAPAAPPAAEPVAAAAPAHGTAGYSAPTTLGNSRITDAQRARAEGRSPIIPPGMQPAGITAGLGLLLALGAAIGQYALVVPLVLLQAVTAAGWFRLNGMWPARQGIALAFAGGLVADVALLAAGRENGPAAILGTLGVWVLLTVVLQLRSHAGADERMEGLMATVASAALSVLAAGHLAAVPDAVTVGAVAVAVAVLVRALPLPGPATVVLALLAAAGGGAVAGSLTDLGTKGALLGLAAGVCALIGLRVASYDYPSRFVHMTAGVALPLTAAAPAVYLLGRALS